MEQGGLLEYCSLKKLNHIRLEGIQQVLENHTSSTILMLEMKLNDLWNDLMQ